MYVHVCVCVHVFMLNHRVICISNLDCSQKFEQPNPASNASLPAEAGREDKGWGQLHFLIHKKMI